MQNSVDKRRSRFFNLLLLELLHGLFSGFNAMFLGLLFLLMQQLKERALKIEGARENCNLFYLSSYLIVTVM
jgi:hypothetical protein